LANIALLIDRVMQPENLLNRFVVVEGLAGFYLISSALLVS
jgi:hypothetical protein